MYCYLSAFLFWQILPENILLQCTVAVLSLQMRHWENYIR